MEELEFAGVPEVDVVPVEVAGRLFEVVPGLPPEAPDVVPLPEVGVLPGLIEVSVDDVLELVFISTVYSVA